MLSDQGSPYVGRFARGWRRLPGRIPGQPQTRTRARSSIGTRRGARERPRCGHEVDRDGACLPQRLRGCRRGRARREDIVDEQDMCGDGDAFPCDERTSHRRSAVGGMPLCLRSGRDGSAKQPSHRKAERRAHAGRQDLGLVESSLSEAAARQGDPGDHVGRRRQVVERRDRTRQRGSDPPPAGELESVHRATCRSFEPEGRAGSIEHRRRAVATRRHRRRPGAAAARTPRRDQRHELIATPGTEGPRPDTAARTPMGEDHLQRLCQHRPTLSRVPDTTTPRAVAPRRDRRRPSTPR